MVEQRGARRVSEGMKVTTKLLRGEVSGTCRFLGLNSGSAKGSVMCDGWGYGARTAMGQHEGLS